MMFEEFEQIGEDLNDLYDEMLTAFSEEYDIATTKIEQTDTTSADSTRPEP